MTPAGDALVLFGATGDLAAKKLFPALFELERHGQLHVPVVGVASSAWDDAAVREYAAASVRTDKGISSAALRRKTAGGTLMMRAAP